MEKMMNPGKAGLYEKLGTGGLGGHPNIHRGRFGNEYIVPVACYGMTQSLTCRAYEECT